MQKGGHSYEVLGIFLRNPMPRGELSLAQRQSVFEKEAKAVYRGRLA